MRRIRSGRFWAGRKPATHSPIGFRVTVRGSLAGNVSLSSSSSRWSAQCQFTFSDVDLVAGALFRTLALSGVFDRFKEVFISNSTLIQVDIPKVTSRRPGALKKEPDAHLGFIDPVLKQTCGGHIAGLLTKRMHLAHVSRHLHVVFAEFG